MDTALNLHCPTCGAVIASVLGSRAGSLRQAVELQAARFGTEVTCRECGGMHVIQRTEAAQNAAPAALLKLHDAAAS